MKKFILFVVALATCFISCNKDEVNVSPTEIPVTETFRLKFSSDFNDESMSVVNAYYNAIGLDISTIGDRYEEVIIPADSYQSAVDSFLVLMSKAEATVGSVNDYQDRISVWGVSLSKGEVVYKNTYGDVIDAGFENIYANMFHSGFHFTPDNDLKDMPPVDTYIKDFYVDHFHNCNAASDFFVKHKDWYHSTDCNSGDTHSDYVVISIDVTDDPNEAVTDAFIYCYHGVGVCWDQHYKGILYEVAKERDNCCASQVASLNRGQGKKNNHELYLYYTKNHKLKQVMRSWVGLPTYRCEDFHKWDVKWPEGGKLRGYQQFCHGTPWYDDVCQDGMKLEQRDFGPFDDNSGCNLNRGDGRNTDWIHLLFQFRWMGDEPWKKVEE